MIILEAILMGIFATFLMDVLAGFLAKKKLMFAFITPEEVGRWFCIYSEENWFMRIFAKHQN